MSDISIEKPRGESPLREFSAVLKEAKKNVGTGTDRSGNATSWETIQFDFIELEVIEATEPYPYPTASIFIRYSNPQTSRGKTRWEAFADSARQFTKDLNELVGKRQTWKMLPKEIRAALRDEEGNAIPDPKRPGSDLWGDVAQDCFCVVAVEGMAQPLSGGDILDYVVGLLDGKDESTFNSLVLQDATARANPKIIEQVTKRELLPTLQSAGMAWRDADGVWHKGSEHEAAPATKEAANAG